MFSMLILGAVLYGTTVLLPEFLQNLMGYSAAQAGECMALGGFLMMITMPLSGVLTGKMDPRVLMAFGFGATSLGLYHMATHLTLGMDFGTAAMLRTYQVAGLAFIFIPSNVLCYAGVPREKNNQVSSMMNFVRNIGGSIGIALISTFVTRSTQTRQSYMTAHMNNGNPKFRQMVEGLSATLQSGGLSAAQATKQAYARMEFLMEQQAAALAFKDVVAILAIVVACLIPLAFIMKKPAVSERVPPREH
jgi:DHA2 family multidrug resistance protein